MPRGPTGEGRPSTIPGQGPACRQERVAHHRNFTQETTLLCSRTGHTSGSNSLRAEVKVLKNTGLRGLRASTTLTSALNSLQPTLVFSQHSTPSCFRCNAGDLGSIPGWGRSPGEGNGNPLRYSCLGNPTDRGTWWATVHRVTK